MHVKKRRCLAVDHPGTLPPDLLEVLLHEVDVETKLACALASSELRQQLMTSRCWPQEVRLDLHDSRQLKWLQHHIAVVERLSICLEDSLISRFNRLLRCGGAPHLTSLSIHMAPDDVEHSRMQVFELRGLQLEKLSLHHRGWTPVFSTHHLPTTLRSLMFSDVQQSDAHVFFRGREVRQCLALVYNPVWRFVCELPTSVTHLRLTCEASDLRAFAVPGTLRRLEKCSSLEELDLDLARDPWKSFSKQDLGGCVPVAEALASLSLKRVGLHACSGCRELYIPGSYCAEMHRSFYIGGPLRATNRKGAPFWSQMDDASRRCVTKLTLHFQSIRSCPRLSGCSVLRELVLADACRGFSDASPTPFAVKGLAVVAATLRHLTVSSSRKDTYVVLPPGLRLSSFVCVCSGTLILRCDAHTLGQGLGDVLLGYTTLDGTGARLAEVLGPRLKSAVLQVLGLESLRQSLMFTRAGLVGEWWHGVFQASKQQAWAGYLCCRVQVSAQGGLCPPYLTFPRYGIVTPHEDRGVVQGPWDDPEITGTPERARRPAWHFEG